MGEAKGKVRGYTLTAEALPPDLKREAEAARAAEYVEKAEF